MFSHFKIRPAAYTTANRGFGLVELMVSISIMMLLSVVIITRQTSFNGAVLLRNQAYEVAFAIRKAQLLAVSGTNVGSATTTQQYGVYFDTSAGNNQSYFVFHDLNANGQWDAGDVPVGVTNHLDSRFVIRRIANVNGGNLSGSTGFAISFIRPNFDAKFNDNFDPAYEGGPAYVDISTTQAATSYSNHDVGSVRRVLVTSTGQISVTSF